MAGRSPHIMVIDPGVKSPEIDTFNNIASMAPIACSYHLPALFGFESFPEDLTLVRAIIVLGSASSVHDRLPWQIQLEQWVQTAIDQDIPVLGCCYGHQMLAYMYGGDINFIKPDREKLKGVRRVQLLKNPVWPAGDRRMIVTHCETVTRLPAEMRTIAQSDEIAIDGLMHENKPVFGFQSHPEATKMFLKGHEMLDDQALHVLPDGHEIIRRFVHMAVGKST